MTLRRLAILFYRVALAAFPRRHRRMYAAEMIDTFDRELAARRRDRGAAQALWFVSAAIGNVVGAGLGERQRHWQTGLTATTGFSWMDLRLAGRMFGRYPGLSLVSVFGMAVGIGVAAGAFTIVQVLLDPVIPLDEGERVVGIVNLDAATTNSESRVMHDFATWRTLSSLEDISAVVTTGRTLIAEGGQPETVSVAQMSASGFRVARVSPKLGRYLLAEDERPGAPDVVVIGHQAWQRRFGGDTNIIGRELQLGSVTYAIVGVMPDGFGFPVNDNYWIPWRFDPTRYEPRTGPAVTVFARLVPGLSLESAQAELTPIGLRMAADSPASHQHLRPRVVPFTYAYSGMAETGNALGLRLIEISLVMLLLVVCVNVAILVYARTATRQGEIAIRSALGASRRRIVAQLFVEALLLAGVAAAMGVGLLSVAFEQLDAALRRFIDLPFWMSFQLSTEGAIYVVALTLLAAAIVGIVPALKATGRRVQAGSQGIAAGAGSRMQMGRLWTLLIVAQVGLTVALLPASMYHAWQTLRHRTGDRGFASRQFLSTQLVIDRPADQPQPATSDDELRRVYASRQVELERLLESEPGVAAVTFSLTNPGEELAAVLEVEGMPPPVDLVDYNIVEGTKQGHLVRFNRIAPDFLAAFDVPAAMGRTLAPGDRGVLVNRVLADTLFGAANPLGQRVRYVGRSRETGENNLELDRWYEIVGVVPDFPRQSVGAPPVLRLYHAVAPGDVLQPMLSLRVHGALPSTFASRLREISAAVDPNIQLRDVVSFDEAVKREQGMMRLIGMTIALVMLSVVVLSAAGIYALMSFTVARRRKEIGIRTALGADPLRILVGVFSRAFAQLTAGALVGLLGAVALEQVLEGEMFQGQGAVILPIVAAFMTMVGLLAAVGPARRGLRVHPTEALRAE
jgi:putative ABC transport system permease protein